MRTIISIHNEAVTHYLITLTRDVTIAEFHGSNLSPPGITGSPVTIMADAAVTSSCTEEGEYGRYRLWGAIGEMSAIERLRYEIAMMFLCL